MSQVQKHFDAIAGVYDFYKQKNWFYYTQLMKLLARLIPAGQVVLEVGCGSGDLLAGIRPQRGYGIDISSGMIRLARRRHRARKFLFSIQPVEKFEKHRLDYIFMSDVIEHLESPQAMFDQIARAMQPWTQLVITMANPIWEPILLVGEKLGLKMPEGPHQRWSSGQMKQMLQAAGLQLIKHERTLLVPIRLPIITEFANIHLEPWLKPLAFIEYFIATKP